MGKVSPAALLPPGKTGAFDDAGVTLGSLVSANGRQYLFYTGWNLTVSVPFNNSIGIAEYRDGAFLRLGDGPVMTRTLHEPYSCASPFVIHEDGRFRMWYASMDRWQEESSGVRHYYNINTASPWMGRTGRDKVSSRSTMSTPVNMLSAGPSYWPRMEATKCGTPCGATHTALATRSSRDGVRWERQDERAGIDVSVRAGIPK